MFTLLGGTDESAEPMNQSRRLALAVPEARVNKTLVRRAATILQVSAVDRHLT
jgi:hypothetical protein